MAEEMWQKNIHPFAEKVRYGKGMIYPTASLEQILSDLRIQPDFTASDPMLPVLFIHLATQDGEVYFVSNQSDKTISFDANFRAKGMQPELWNPLTSETRYLPEFKQLTGAISVPMTLAGNESSFVIFREKAKTEGKGQNYPEATQVATINAPWTIEFEAHRGGPEKPIVTEKLFDWMESEDLKIKYFSGNAIYKTTFTIDKLPESPVYMDLGKVMVMAKVRINGQEAGGVWTAPYQVGITGLLKEGVNELEVEVVNCWRNRLVGELFLPEKERFTFHTAATINEKTPMQSSGLLGPVQIISYPYEMVECVK
jgi:hypothetical protein